MSKSNKTSSEVLEHAKRMAASYHSLVTGNHGAANNLNKTTASKPQWQAADQQPLDDLFLKLKPQGTSESAIPAVRKVNLSWPKIYEHFGLLEEPFRLNLDLRFYFNGRTPSEALASLLSRVGMGVRTQVLIGEPGTGKSMLLRKAADMLRSFGNLALVEANPLSNTVDGILNELADQAELDCKEIAVPEQKLAAILGALHKQSQGTHAVLFIDEAQAFPFSLKNDLLRLAQTEIEGQTLQLVFSGLDMLEAELTQPTPDQPMPLLTESYRLQPLSTGEVAEYVIHRLRVAGALHPEEPMGEAIQQIANHSGGIPSKINSLCSNALLISYLEGAHSVSAETVSKIALEGLQPQLEQTHSETWVTSTAKDDDTTQSRSLFTLTANEDAVHQQHRLARNQGRIVFTPPQTRASVNAPKRTVIFASVIAGMMIGGGFALWWPSEKTQPGATTDQRVATSTFTGTPDSGRTNPDTREPEMPKIESASIAPVGAPGSTFTASRFEEHFAEPEAPPSSGVVSTQTAPVVTKDTAAAKDIAVTEDSVVTEDIVVTEENVATEDIVVTEDIETAEDLMTAREKPGSAEQTVEFADTESSSPGATPPESTDSDPAENEPMTTLPVASSLEHFADNATPAPSEVASTQTEPVAEDLGTAKDTKTMRENPDSGDHAETLAETEPLIPGVTLLEPGNSKPADQRVADELPATDVTATESAALVLETLMERGNGLLATGDLAGARLFFELAAQKGVITAATGVGKTYDPLFYASVGVAGAQPNPDLAMQWYQKASEAGDEEGVTRLTDLYGWLEQAALRGNEQARRLLESP